MQSVCRNVMPVDSQTCPCRLDAMMLSIQLLMRIYEGALLELALERWRLKMAYSVLFIAMS